MNNNYNFEEFTEYGGKFDSKISLSRYGGFGFSSGMFNRYKLGSAVGLKMYFDPEKRAVAFRFLDKEEDKMIRLKQRQSGGFVSAIAFLKKYSMDPYAYCGRYKPDLIIDSHPGKMFVIELKKQEL